MDRIRGLASTTATLALAFFAGIAAGEYLWFVLDFKAFHGVFVPPRRYESLAQSAPELQAILVGGGVGLAAAVLACTAAVLLRRRPEEFLPPLRWSSLWLLLLPLHQWACLQSADSASDSAFGLIVSAGPIVASVSLAGWLSNLWGAIEPRNEDAEGPTAWLPISAAFVVYAAVFSILSILQYRALHVPHGDSAMYEEHLWNVLHGKGFRSQLDDGRPFFGEHFQVFHLLLLPIYGLAPSLETLLICESIALAAGSFAVLGVARAMGLTTATGGRLGIAWLLYVPLQMLQMEASWKCFRPEAFAAPILMAALWGLERNRRILFLFALALAASCKEEYFLVAAALGVYSACRAQSNEAPRTRILWSLGLTVFSIASLSVVLGLWLPYFRGGEAPHYTPYFASFGESPAEILRNVLANPGRVAERLASVGNLRFVLLMLGPLGFLPLASPARLLVAAPIFGYLMLGDREGMNEPWFHFHAPLVPLLWWSAVGGVANLGRGISPAASSRWLVWLTLLTGVWYGRGPASWRFYDPVGAAPRRDGRFEPRGAYWRDVYFSPQRAESFEKLLAELSPEERVSATDYLRSRLTHFSAAFDYPNLRKHVTIDDVDVIVLDATEGWWGRGPTNPDHALLACLENPKCAVGTPVTVRDRPFLVIYHDPWILAVRRIREVGSAQPAARPEERTP